MICKYSAHNTLKVWAVDNVFPQNLWKLFKTHWALSVAAKGVAGFMLKNQFP